MQKRKARGFFVLVFVLLCAVAASGCSSLQQPIAMAEDTSTSTLKPSPDNTAESSAMPDDQLLVEGYAPIISDTDKDDIWSLEAATQVNLSGDSAEVIGTGAASVDGCVKISAAGTYVLTGELKDGRVVVAVDSDESTTIVLNGVDITCSTSAPLNIANGDIKLILAAGTQNTLTDGTQYQYADETIKEPNACLYADDNLTISGTGALNINANFNNGIGSKDELRIVGGKITVDAKNNAIKGNDCVLICGGEIAIQSSGDGLKSDNEKEEGRGCIIIDEGIIHIISSDDALQATSSITITGGNVSTKAGGKRINCDGALSIAAGCLE